MGLSQRASTLLAFFSLLLLASCSQRGASPSEDQDRAQQVDPFDGFELPEVEAGAVEGGATLPVIYLTTGAVVIGANVPARVEGGVVDDLGAVERALRRVTAGQPRLALGVDRRLSFTTIRPVLAVIESVGVTALEIRLGQRERPRGVRLCLVGGGPAGRAEGARDCWGRPRPSPPAIADAGEDGGGATRRGDARPQGDITDRPLTTDWSAPLGLGLSLEPDYVLIRLHDRSLRSLLLDRSREGSLASQVGRQVEETLQPMRERNSWDRRVSLRVADGVLFGDVAGLLQRLCAASFDQISLDTAAHEG